jgi:hypothetical protein
LKRHFKSLTVALILGGLVRPVSVFAILGIGDIVFDPTSYGELVSQLAELEQQYLQLVQTYQMVHNQFKQMVRNAQQVPVNMAARYRALANPWRMESATNTYGTTGDWIIGMNTGQGVMAGYAASTRALRAYGAAFGDIPGDQVERVKTDYATVELTDGANLSGMETIGRIRGGAAAVNAALSNLEDDSLSSDPDMNTEVAVLNKINAANIFGLRTAQDTNQLLVAVAEQQIIQAKRQRDAEAQAINNDIRFRTEGKAVMAAQTAGVSQAMLAWRMP